jgi:hypothetical protein
MLPERKTAVTEVTAVQGELIEGAFLSARLRCYFYTYRR